MDLHESTQQSLSENFKAAWPKAGAGARVTCCPRSPGGAGTVSPLFIVNLSLPGVFEWSGFEAPRWEPGFPSGSPFPLPRLAPGAWNSFNGRQSL